MCDRCDALARDNERLRETNREQLERLNAMYLRVAHYYNPDGTPKAPPAKVEPPFVIFDARFACPRCNKQHIDEREFVTTPHRVHRCVDDAAGKGCGFEFAATIRGIR